jgi:pyruvate carboxylase subunit B
VRADFEVDGRVRTVSIEGRSPGWSVTLDGAPIDVDLVPLGGGRYSLRLPAHGAQHEVVVSSGRERDDLEVAVGGTHVVVRRRVAGSSSRHGAATSGEGQQRLVAPMPGKVVRVLVAPGDEVHARQGVVVVEAMKMENELRATRAGRVTSVKVGEGTSVERGAVLIVME